MDLQALVESDMEGAMEGVKISNNDKNVSKTNKLVHHVIHDMTELDCFFFVLI